MKRILPWIFLIAVISSVYACSVILQRLVNSEYNFETYAYIIVGGIVVILLCLLYRAVYLHIKH